MTNKGFYSDKLLAIVIWNQNQCQLLHEMVFGKIGGERRGVVR